MYFGRRIPPGVEGFRVRCPLPKGFRVDTEHLRRSTPSHFAPIRTLLPGAAQRVKLLTELARGAPSASGHLAQRERRVWVFPGPQADPSFFFLTTQRRRDGAKHPHVLSSSSSSSSSSFSSSTSFFSSSFLSFQNCCSQILSMFHVCAVCVFFLVSPPGGCSHGVTLKKKKKKSLFLLFPPGGRAFTKKNTLPGA